MSLPARGEVYMQFLEHLAHAQEDAAKLAHLHADDERTGKAMAAGFLAISEAIRIIGMNVRTLATKGRLQ